MVHPGIFSKCPNKHFFKPTNLLNFSVTSTLVFRRRSNTSIVFSSSIEQILTPLDENTENLYVHAYIALKNHKSNFNVGVAVQGFPVTDQNGLDICWIFAATNIIRLKVMTSLNLLSMEVSSAYFFYYHKM